MRTPRPIPTRLEEAVFFSRGEATDELIDANRLRAGDVQRPFHGVQALRVPTSLRERCLAYSKRMRPTDRFSHLTALALHDLPLPPGASRRTALDVAAVHPAAAPSTKGVIGHRLRSAPPTVVVDGLVVCDAVEAWCQIAGLVEIPDLVAVADEPLNRADDPAAARVLLQRAIDVPHRYRTLDLRRALDLARPGSRSAQESRLRAMLVIGGIPEPALNAPVLARDGRIIGHGDLVWLARRVVSEYEGDQHRSDHEQWSYDIRRYDDYADNDWTLVRVPAESLHLEHRAALIARFRRALGLD